VAVSIAAVATAATQGTTRPLGVVLVGPGQHYVEVIEVRLQPVGVDQHISAAHAPPSLPGLVSGQHLQLYLSL
jgi:hypothetical protein